MECVHVLTAVILILTFLCVTDCRGRGGRGRSGSSSRSRSKSSSGSVSETSSSNTGNLHRDSIHSGFGFRDYSSNSASKGIGFKPEYRNSGSQGIGFKHEYSNLGSQGIGFKPEYSNLGSKGIGFKPEYSNLGSKGIGFKPEYSNLGSQGIGFKPEYSNLGSQGIGFKPEYSNLGSQGIGFKPEYTHSNQRFFNGGNNNYGNPHPNPGSYDQTYGTGFKPNDGFQLQYLGVNQRPYYDRPSLPMILPIGTGNTHHTHYYSDRRTHDNYNVYGRSNSSQVDALNPGFIEVNEITPFYKPGYILPNKDDDARLKNWRAMILKKFGTTNRPTTVTQDDTSTPTSTVSFIDKLFDSSVEDEMKKRMDNLGLQ